MATTSLPEGWGGGRAGGVAGSPPPTALTDPSVDPLELDFVSRHPPVTHCLVASDRVKRPSMMANSSPRTQSHCGIGELMRAPDHRVAEPNMDRVPRYGDRLPFAAAGRRCVHASADPLLQLLIRVALSSSMKPSRSPCPYLPHTMIRPPLEPFSAPMGIRNSLL